MNKPSNNRIRLFVPTFEIQECLDEIRECFELGWTGAGFKTAEFEQDWNAYSKSKYSVFLNSNTTGLDIAVQVLRNLDQNGKRNEVISTPLTFVSTNHAILRADLTPVFADVDEALCMDPIKMKEAITDRTLCVIFVGIGGNTGQLREIS